MGGDESCPALWTKAALLCVALCACSKGSGNQPPEIPIDISISPTAVTMNAGSAQTFTALVTGTTRTAVDWSLSEIGAGTLTGSGEYTAPSAAGVYHVVATSEADQTKTATATITVIQPVAVVVSPGSATVDALQTVTFTAFVTGTSNGAVTWSVVEPGGGAINSAGVYTASATVGTYHVTAVSQADATKSGSATVTVGSGASIVISPFTASLPFSGSVAFSAAVTGVSNTAVVWSVQETGGGLIDATGRYTAPNAPGTYHVIATSVADPTHASSATLSVVTGRFMFAPSFNESTINVLAVDGTHIGLRSQGYAIANSPTDRALHAVPDISGRFLLVANFTGSVGVFSLNASTGVLTQVPGSPFVTGGSQPAKLSIDPTNRYVYVSNFMSNNVTGFTLNSTTGALTAIGLPYSSGNRPWISAVRPSGKYLYVLNQNGNSVSSYSIDAGTGVLTSLGSAVPIRGDHPL